MRAIGSRSDLLRRSLKLRHVPDDIMVHGASAVSTKRPPDSCINNIVISIHARITSTFPTTTIVMRTLSLSSALAPLFTNLSRGTTRVQLMRNTSTTTTITTATTAGTGLYIRGLAVCCDNCDNIRSHPLLHHQAIAERPALLLVPSPSPSVDRCEHLPMKCRTCIKRRYMADDAERPRRVGFMPVLPWAREDEVSGMDPSFVSLT